MRLNLGISDSVENRKPPSITGPTREASSSRISSGSKDISACSPAVSSSRTMLSVW